MKYKWIQNFFKKHYLVIKFKIQIQGILKVDFSKIKQKKYILNTKLIEKFSNQKCVVVYFRILIVVKLFNLYYNIKYFKL